jgi:hypothetical protein
MSEPQHCVAPLQAVVHKLEAQGVAPAVIVAALAEVTVEAAQRDRSGTAAHLQFWGAFVLSLVRALPELPLLNPGEIEIILNRMLASND